MDLKGIKLELTEPMSGWICVGETSYIEGRVEGRRKGTPIFFKMKITFRDVEEFLISPDRSADLHGTVTFGPLGADIPIRNGRFTAFAVNKDSGIYEMTYSFEFTAENGKDYFLYGHKDLKGIHGFDALKDLTTLYTTIYAGKDTNAPVYGAGQIFFYMKDSPAFFLSFKGIGGTWFRRMAAKTAFLSFAFGIVRETYLKRIKALYDTSYRNLVLSGKALISGSSQADFFFVSGVHEKGFPWGDGATFSDVLLVLRNGDEITRYCFSDHMLPGQIVDIENGRYSYDGPLFKLEQGYSASFLEMRKGRGGLKRCTARINIIFKAAPHALTPMPLRSFGNVFDDFSYFLSKTLRKFVSSERLFGIDITPHDIDVIGGELQIDHGNEKIDIVLDPSETFGEGEISVLRNVTTPTMYYHYLCALPPKDRIEVQIEAGAFRSRRQYWIKDKIYALVGSIARRFVSTDIKIDHGSMTVTRLSSGKRLVKKGVPLLEVNNDHYPTGILQRNIVEVTNNEDGIWPALEENMDLFRKASVESDEETVVAALKGEIKFCSLKMVLEKTGFWDVLNRRLSESGKTKDEFSIVIKPNFMFAYNVLDHSTYTDPELVQALVLLLRHAGFSNIGVVEAQSAYGEYFNRRGVLQMADYLGYDVTGKFGYKVVDLTTDSREYEHLGENLGNHPVPKTWKEADFRISFAKNKTHAYAFYTLTIKNIYGALCLSDKFGEYHIHRGIYDTTTDYLQIFPVHFGIIDAFSSSDGPFGVFSDCESAETKTILGGSNLVAVDWVGASKMGIDPMISHNMKSAVKAFGKPRIIFVGDPSPYRPWLNVPAGLTFFTNRVVDASAFWGDLFYKIGAYMDEDHFTHKSRSLFIRIARRLIKPFQTAVFMQAGGKRTRLNRLFYRFLAWMSK